MAGKRLHQKASKVRKLVEFCAKCEGSIVFLCMHGAHRSTGTCLLLMTLSGIELQSAADSIEKVRYVADLSSYGHNYASSRSRVQSLLECAGICAVVESSRAAPQTARPRGEEATAKEEAKESDNSNKRPRGEEAEPEEEADDLEEPPDWEGNEEEEDPAALQEAWAKLKDELVALKEDVDHLRAKKEQLKKEKRKLKEDVDDLENVLDDVESDVMRLTQERDIRQGIRRPSIEEACQMVRNRQWEEPASSSAGSEPSESGARDEHRFPRVPNPQNYSLAPPIACS